MVIEKSKRKKKVMCGMTLWFSGLCTFPNTETNKKKKEKKNNRIEDNENLMKYKIDKKRFFLLLHLPRSRVSGKR